MRAFLPVVVISAMLILACSGHPEPLSEAATGANLLLISLDTTRADRLGPYGYAAAETPALDRLAKSGVVFERCFSPAPITLPAHSSLMTGTDPFVHGVRDNGSFRLHESNVTLAEALQQAGYRTAAEVAAFVLNREFGLDQGFDRYEDTSAVADTVLNRTSASRRGDSVADAAIERLREFSADARPFFLFVHFFDPHAPYDPPGDWSTNRAHPYDGEIAYTDAQVGRILKALERLGLAENTVVVVTADHGEGLGEHDEDTHTVFLYDSTLRVPLIISAPGRLPGGLRVPGDTRLIDVAPTLLDLLGLDPLERAQGTSLLARMSRREGSATPVYGESFYPRFGYGYSQLRSWRHGGLKYIHAPTPELYDLQRDPGETVNLAEERPQDVARLRSELFSWILDAPRPPDSDHAIRVLDDESRAKLRALGYAANSAQPITDEVALFDPEGDDPKDHVIDLRIAARVLGLIREEDWGAAEALVRRLVSLNPKSAIAHSNLATLLTNRGGSVEEAVVHFERAAELVPTSDRWAALAAALERNGERERALDVYARATSTPPVFASAHVAFARALRDVGRLEDAAKQYSLGIERDSDNRDARLGLGRTRLIQRRPDEALAAFRSWVGAAPEDAEGHRGVGEAMLQKGEAAAALPHLRAAVELAPDNPATHLGVCVAAEAKGDLAVARAACSRALELTSSLGDERRAQGIRARLQRMRE